MHEVASPKFSERTTLHIGGIAIAELIPDNLDELEKCFIRAKDLGGTPFYIGRGSNILANDGTLPFVLINLSYTNKIEITGRYENKILVHAGAAVPLRRLLRFCMQNNLSGLEGLTGIPGNVGGTCAMNAGSFGMTICDIIHEIEVYTSYGLKIIKFNELQPEYRKLNFKNLCGNPLITGATFVLTPLQKSVIFNRMNLNFFTKKSRQPVTAWTAGCAFKNPVGGISAGKLLENAGFKGKKYGGMAFSAKHANFLVNEGNGCANAAFDLLAEAKDAVAQKFGIRLEEEVRIIS